ncbi:exonuclease/endonuclease/phosphatase family protein [Parabacteroides johnsonii]
MFETTSVNAYSGIITAPDKTLKVRVKAVKDLALKMKSNYLKRAEQADMICAEIERSPYPVLVCGNFNDTPTSYTYHRTRESLIDSFRDCGSGYQYTFR